MNWQITLKSCLVESFEVVLNDDLTVVKNSNVCKWIRYKLIIRCTYNVTTHEVIYNMLDNLNKMFPYYSYILWKHYVIFIVYIFYWKIQNTVHSFTKLRKSQILLWPSSRPLISVTFNRNKGHLKNTFPIILLFDL